MAVLAASQADVGQHLVRCRRIDETLDSLGGNQWFCTLDLQSGYWQIGMKEEDKEKTAFTSHIGLYQFELMPFGLCNAPATFEAMMETLLSDLLWRKCLVYLDDVIVFGKTFEECALNLGEVLERIRSNGLTLKPKKCELFRKSMVYSHLEGISSSHWQDHQPGECHCPSWQWRAVQRKPAHQNWWCSEQLVLRSLCCCGARSGAVAEASGG